MGTDLCPFFTLALCAFILRFILTIQLICFATGFTYSDIFHFSCFNLDTAAHLATVKFEEGLKLLKGDAQKTADAKRRSLLVTIGQMKNEFQKLQTR